MPWNDEIKLKASVLAESIVACEGENTKNKIKAIKLYRRITGADLCESKEMIESAMKVLGIARAVEDERCAHCNGAGYMKRWQYDW